jgi:cold shock CspA family protein
MADRRLSMVRRAFPERGFWFIRPMIKTHDGRGAIDHEAEDIFLHVSQLKASGLKALEIQDVVFFDTHVSPRSGKVEARNVWPAK